MSNNKTYPNGIEIITGTILRNNKDEILLITSPKWKGKWTLPGGHIEAGETIDQAAAREVEEELGLRLKPVSILGFRELIDPADFHRGAHFISFICVLDAENKIISQVDHEEISEYKWILPEDALRENLADDLHEVIEEYIDFCHMESISADRESRMN